VGFAEQNQAIQEARTMSGKQRYYQGKGGRGGYRPGYSEAHSPFWAAGMADREADEARAADGKERLGMDPEKSWSAMYRRGYTGSEG
jgi:hypothetical protein